MSSESIVSALFLITAVIAAGVLINAIFPIITQTAGTFGSVSHEADVRIRTDIKIVNTFAQGSGAKIWLKNIGTERIHENNIEGSDIFIGPPGGFERVSGWTYQILEGNGNNYWDQGETLEITLTNPNPPSEGDVVYFQIVLPTGVTRSIEFKAS